MESKCTEMEEVVMTEKERIRVKLDIEIGCYILKTIFKISEFDLIDAYKSIFSNFVPANYICCREAYYWK